MDPDRSGPKMEAAVDRMPLVLNLPGRNLPGRIRRVLNLPVRMTDPKIGRQEPRLPEATNPEAVARDQMLTAMNHHPASTDLAPKRIAHPKAEDATIDRVRPADGHPGTKHPPNHRWTESEK
jgi:hypothetical protein